MRKRWTAQKRGHEDDSKEPEIQSVEEKDTPLLDKPSEEPADTLAETDNSSPVSLSERGSWKFVEPTPKAGFRGLPKRQKFEIIDLEEDGADVTQVAVNDQPIPSFDKNTLEVNAFAASDFKVFKQPWEKGRMGKLLGKQLDFGRSVPPVDSTGRHGWTVRLGWKEQSLENATISEIQSAPLSSIYQSVVRSAPELDYFEERDAKRKKAVSLWWELVASSLSDSAIGRQVTVEATMETVDECGRELLDAVFGLKSPNTLLKRFYSLKAYADWCSKELLVQWLPIVETDVWSYMKWLKNTEAPPTKATSLMEAIRFGWYIIGFAGAGEVQNSLRLKGISSQMFIKKKPWRPAALLEVKEIVLIHDFLEDVSKDLIDRVFAGHLLHLLYVRGRWSDLAAVQHGEIDEDGQFLEFSTQHHKGAKGQEAKSRLLPLVAPCKGVTGTNWCKTYLDVREKAGLPLPQEVPLAMLLAPARHCAMDWTSRALTSQEGTAFLRKLLGVPTDSDRRVSTHSLKSTAISWCSKFGLCFESRALLSRHISAVSNPTALYSRDLISAVMREFCQVVEQIAKSRFEPDRTRSGMITPSGDLANPATPIGPSSASRLVQDAFERGPSPIADNVVEDELAEEILGPFSKEALDRNEDVEQPDQEGLDMESSKKCSFEKELSETSESDPSVYTSSEGEASEEEQPKPQELVPRDPLAGEFYINNNSLVIHLVSRPGFFRCGRKLGWLYTRLFELNGIRCSRCFNV